MTNRLKQRRGAITVMTALIFLSLVTCMAIAIDFSRLWTVRGELQTSADAGSLAGAMQFIRNRDTLRFSDSARAYARRNRTLGDTIKIDSIIKGNFNGTTRVFTPTPSGTLTSNAVNVVVSYLPSRMWMRSFGATVPRMKARAIAWAGAPVDDDPGCVKPWAIPYESLMYSLNVYRGITPANSNANLNRAWDPVADINALALMTQAQRTFNLKLGSGTPTGGYGGSSMPGNFQAVTLPRLWRYATQSYTNPTPQGGASRYEANIDGTNCPSLSVGDSLATEPGNMAGPTVDGACNNNVNAALTTCDAGAPCAYMVGSGTSIGNCLNAAQDSNSVMIKAAFYACGSSCGGRTNVGVKLMGSFILSKVYPKKQGTHDKAEIVGIFTPTQSGGAAGGGSTTLQRLLLAK